MSFIPLQIDAVILEVSYVEQPPLQLVTHALPQYNIEFRLGFWRISTGLHEVYFLATRIQDLCYLSFSTKPFSLEKRADSQDFAACIQSPAQKTGRKRVSPAMSFQQTVRVGFSIYYTNSSKACTSRPPRCMLSSCLLTTPLPTFVWRFRATLQSCTEGLWEASQNEQGTRLAVGSRKKGRPRVEGR